MESNKITENDKSMAEQVVLNDIFREFQKKAPEWIEIKTETDLNKGNKALLLPVVSVVAPDVLVDCVDCAVPTVFLSDASGNKKFLDPVLQISKDVLRFFVCTFDFMAADWWLNNRHITVVYQVKEILAIRNAVRKNKDYKKFTIQMKLMAEFNGLSWSQRLHEGAWTLVKKLWYFNEGDRKSLFYTENEWGLLHKKLASKTS